MDTDRMAQIMGVTPDVLRERLATWTEEDWAAEEARMAAQYGD